MLDAPVRMEDKLAKAKALLLSFQSRQKVTLKKLQSLVVFIGSFFLNFACSVIVPERPYVA